MNSLIHTLSFEKSTFI